MNSRINFLANLGRCSRLLRRLPSSHSRASYSRQLSRIKKLVEEAAVTQTMFGFKDYLLESSGLQQSQFVKRFQACKSIDEVLLFAFAGKQMKPSELVACLDALVKVQYRILSSFQWAYYDSELTLWIQADVNSDTEDSFRSLHRHPSFLDLLREIDTNTKHFSPGEVVDALHALLKLFVDREHDVLVRLQEKALQTCGELNLASLGKLSEASNFLKRGGFIVNSLICSLLQESFEAVPLSADSYRDLALVLFNVAYFLSPEYIDTILGKAATILCSSSSDVSPSDTVSFIVAGGRFSTKDPQVVAPFLEHLVRNVSSLSVHQLSSLVRIARFGKFEDSRLKEAVREQALARIERGLLRTSDVVSLVSIFDVVGWTDGLRREFSDLLKIHMSDLDALLIKHMANSSFLTDPAEKNLTYLFANRWFEKLPDVCSSVSALMVLVQLYGRTSIIPKQAQTALEERLVQELKFGQLAMQPDRAVACCNFLFRFGNQKSKEYSLRLLDDMKLQLTPVRIYKLLRSVKFQPEFALRHNVPEIWYSHVVANRQDIPDLQVASYLMNKFFSSSQHEQQQTLSRGDAQVWAEIFEENASHPQLHSLRHTLNCVSNHNLYVPATLEVLCEFALQRGLSVELAMNLVGACAKVDFRPQCFDELGTLYAGQLAEMIDNQKFPVIQGLRFARSLAYLDCLSPPLVQKIFSVELLRKVDAVIEECPEEEDELNQLLFEINRCVVLQHPELDIPWIWSGPPQNAETSAGIITKSNDFRSSVGDVLRDISGGDGLIRPKVLSPYFHPIDFECHTSDEFGFVSLHDIRIKPELSFTRHAIVLLDQRDFCSNEDHILGDTATKLRHLEILGYHVIKIPHNEFSSLNMDSQAKRDYLQKKIFGR
ncbi:uncharacterized protein ISCGN_011357 [Ixodes scapularis]